MKDNAFVTCPLSATTVPSLLLPTSSPRPQPEVTTLAARQGARATIP